MPDNADGGLVVSMYRNDYSFPFHLDRWWKEDGVPHRRLISRHRTLEAAKRAQARAERAGADDQRG